MMSLFGGYGYMSHEHRYAFPLPCPNSDDRLPSRARTRVGWNKFCRGKPCECRVCRSPPATLSMPVSQKSITHASSMVVDSLPGPSRLLLVLKLQIPRKKIDYAAPTAPKKEWAAASTQARPGSENEHMKTRNENPGNYPAHSTP